MAVWGQMDRNLPLTVEKSLLQMTMQFDNGFFLPTLESLRVGFLCCAKYKDGNYYRARITNLAMINQNVIEVHFIDFGNKDIVSVGNLRTLCNFTPGLTSFPPQARDFIIANVTHKGTGWDNDTISVISSEIRYLELLWSIVCQVGPYTLIKLFKDGDDALAPLFNRGLILSIATNAQQMMLQSIANIQPVYQMNQINPVVSLRPPGIASIVQTPAVMTTIPAQTIQTGPTALVTYKAITLEPGSEHSVYVSYVSDGPSHFSVQLQKLEDSLARLMKELNRMNLLPLEDDPLPGTLCVARCLEDEHICRAVVTSMVDSQYKVFYVDFGNTEVVPLDNLYQIPFKYVIPKVMAMRYALAGLERSSVTLEMKCAFKEFVSDKLLNMRVVGSPVRSTLPLCSLFDKRNMSALDVLKQAALLAYPEVMNLTRGFSQAVRVSFVYSCSHFYVQVTSKEEELRSVMAELQNSCPFSKKLTDSQIRIDMPCCALFEADGQWYRAQILKKESNNCVKVRYVDYGNEELVAIDNLRLPSGEQLTALRPQALECCLNGYQNMGDDQERDNLLEEIILEKEFVMKVVEMQGNRALVDLIDNSRYNVASLLLEKLASLRSQVSPLLIQDSHHIEQRKRKSPNEKGQFRFERKPSRELNEEKSWNHDSNDNKQESWRQKPPRNDQRGGGGDGDGFERNRGNKKDGFKKNSWGGDGDGDGFKKDNWHSKTNGFQKNDWDANSQESKDGDWNKKNESQWRKSPNQGGKFSSRNPNQRDGSDKGNWSDGGSEKNWRRSPRSNNEERPRNNKFDFNKKKGTSFGGSSNFNKRDNFQASTKTVTDPAPNHAEFTQPQIGSNESREVVVSWFHDPTDFFCQLLETQEEFRKMMNDIQAHYVDIKPDNRPVGAPVIAVFPEDSVMYRGHVLEAKGLDFRVQFVDFGNVSHTDKVWPIERKFMTLPAQAICCGLKGLGKPGDAWPAPDKFSTYFSKDSMTCLFVENQNQKYSVELTCDNQNVSESIVAEGLAVYESAANEAYDPSILLGQQIRVTVVEIEALDSFYVQLQNGISLLCTLHNLESATEKYEDVLTNFLVEEIIVYVDNVLEVKTEVTIYETSGNKLAVIEPDEGAYEFIEPLCPLPIIYPTMSGWISFMAPLENEKRRTYLQPSEFANTLAELLDNMFNHYNETEAETIDVEVGKFYAVHSSDGNWYRGQVQSKEDEGIKVSYIDYGNSEVVTGAEIRTLAQQFTTLHMFAIELSTSNVDESFIEQEVTANVWFDDTLGWTAEIIKIGQSGEEKTEVQENKVVEDVQPSETAVPQPVAEEPQRLGISIIISHVDSPSEFYIQFSEDSENIDNLQAMLQEQAEGFPVLESPTAGVLCAAPYIIDQQWYRAQVLDADDDITTVRFVDYGNTDVLSNSTSVKTLPSDLLSLEQHARRCSLFVKPIDAEWSAAASERFDALVSADNLTAEIIHQDEKTTYIDLFANSQNVAEILLLEGLAVKLELETESSCTGYVSHLNSPSEFWIQLESSVADLEWIAEQLSAAQNFPELEDSTPGSLCAALYPDDEMWYRARILSNTVAGLEVLFIDYGNSCTCTGLRQLPEDLIMLSALAQKCSLQKPPGMLQWPVNATEEFKTISADGAAVFNIVKLSTGETSVVQLLLDGDDISVKLISSKQDAYMTFYESPSNFWLQNVDDENKITEMSTKLKEASEWGKYEFKEGNPVVAAFSTTDEQWYRARILNEKDSTFEILLIDFGSTASANDIRELPSDIESITPLASQFKLEVLPGFKWSDETSNQLEKFYNEGTVFQVEFASSNLVRLYLNGIDIRSDLDSISISSTQNTPKKTPVIKDDIEEHDIIDESELIISEEDINKVKETANIDVSSEDINKVKETANIDVRSEDVIEYINRVIEDIENITDTNKEAFEEESKVSKETSNAAEEELFKETVNPDIKPETDGVNENVIHTNEKSPKERNEESNDCVKTSEAVEEDDITKKLTETKDIENAKTVTADKTSIKENVCDTKSEKDIDVEASVHKDNKKIQSKEVEKSANLEISASDADNTDNLLSQ